MQVKIEKTNFHGWANSYRVSNGEVDLVITSDIGPRVMRYGFVGGQNLFKVYPEGLGESGQPKWLSRGGHRLWAAPEDPVRTYIPDNGPVDIQIQGDTLIATEPVEQITNLEKRITIKMAAEGSAVELIHRLRNAGAAPVALAPWSLTMMAQGGMAIHGFPPRGQHPKDLNPTNPLVMSAYTDLSDYRWRFTKKYLLLRQDPEATCAQKLGSWNRDTFGAYLLGSDLFIKRYRAAGSPADYPDFGCSFETFTNAKMLELETVGPMTTLAPGAAVEHVERWTLHKDIRIAAWTDEALDTALLPLL
jgi:hypothetical protein